MKLNYIDSPLTSEQRMEYCHTIAPSLYDGGWRPEDRDAMMKEYNLCEEAVDIIINRMIEIIKANKDDQDNTI